MTPCLPAEASECQTPPFAARQARGAGLPATGLPPAIPLGFEVSSGLLRGVHRAWSSTARLGGAPPYLGKPTLSFSPEPAALGTGTLLHFSSSLVSKHITTRCSPWGNRPACAPRRRAMREAAPQNQTTAKKLPVHPREVAPEIASSVGSRDLDSVDHNRVTLQPERGGNKLQGGQRTSSAPMGVCGCSG